MVLVVPPNVCVVVLCFHSSLNLFLSVCLETVSSIDGQPIKEDSSNASGTDSTTVIVVALCCVVIVALISATVIIIVRKRKPRGNLKSPILFQPLLSLISE